MVSWHLCCHEGAMMIKATKRNVFFTVVTCGILAMLLLFWLPPADSLRIVAILPLSGPAANAGIDVRDGLTLAADEINSLGGLNGHHIELDVLDGETDSDKSMERYREAQKGKKPTFYVTITSRVASALAPLMEKNGDLLFALVATSPDLTTGKKWVYKFYTTPETELFPINQIVASLSTRKLGILYLQDDYGEPVFNLARSIMPQQNIDVTGVGFELLEKDFALKLAPLAECDAVYIVGFQMHIRTLVPLIREKLPDAQIITSNSTDIVFAKDFKALEGIYTAAPVLYDKAYPFALQLDRDFRQRFDRPVDHFAANGYDIVRMIASVMEDKELTPEVIRQQFNNGFLYPGVLGNLVVHPGDHDIAIPLLPARIDKGNINFIRGDLL